MTGVQLSPTVIEWGETQTNLLTHDGLDGTLDIRILK